MAIIVRVGKLPGRLFDYGFEDNETPSVKRALEMAGITLEPNSEVKVNGEISNLNRTLVNGDDVTVGVQIKGA